MERVTLISHGDADGIACVAIALKKFYQEKPKIYFTYPAKLKATLANLISINFLGKIFIFDLSGDDRALALSSAFEKAVWIDHHEWEAMSNYPNVEVVVDKNAVSATELVAKYFNISSELVEIINQVDRDEIKSGSAEFMRNLVGALKWKYSGVLLYNKFLSLSKTLAFQGLEKLEENMSVARLISSYLKFLEEIKEKMMERVKIFDVNGKKVAIFESTSFFPMYILTEKLREHKNAPFDVIIGLIRRIDKSRRKIYTKMELRTQTGENVYAIAKEFGGGGHRVAAAATVGKFLTVDEILNKIKEVKK
jgi:oligoribonuclease NrnB/cAMP/cGMP phosphodiesterase (DHH superfamily)